MAQVMDNTDPVRALVEEYEKYCLQRDEENRQRDQESRRSYEQLFRVLESLLLLIQKSNSEEAPGLLRKVPESSDYSESVLTGNIEVVDELPGEHKGETCKDFPSKKIEQVSIEKVCLDSGCGNRQFTPETEESKDDVVTWEKFKALVSYKGDWSEKDLAIWERYKDILSFMEDGTEDDMVDWDQFKEMILYDEY